jgi:hypothetical protein
MVHAHGKKLMTPLACVNFHSFATRLLQKWDIGIPFDCGASWEWTMMIKATVEKGVHKSATMKESSALILKEVAYQVKKAGYAQVILWEELKILPPKRLKVSPLAMGPQRDQSRCMILDLSFAVCRGKLGWGRKQSHDNEVILQPSANDFTERMTRRPQ